MTGSIPQEARIRPKSREPCENAFRQSLRQKDVPRERRSTSPPGHPKLSPIRKKEQREPSDLPFNDPPFQSLKFGNVAECKDWIYKPLRFTPQSAIHWQLNLRGSDRHKNPTKSSTNRSSSCSSPAAPYPSNRHPGCEGSSVSMWKHLYQTGVSRDTLAWETTLRGFSDLGSDDSRRLTRSSSVHRPNDSIIMSDPKLCYLYSH